MEKAGDTAIANNAQKSQVGVEIPTGNYDQDDACNLFNFGWLEKISSTVNYSLESVFYSIGLFTGTKPWLSILIGLLIFLSPLVGFSRYYQETDQSKLWVPSNARSVEDNQRAKEWFASNSRISQVLIEGSNVLTRENLLKCLDFHSSIIGINVTNKDDEVLLWEDLCVSTGPVCLQSSILELWAYDRTLIESSNELDIANRISNPVSPFTNTGMELNLLLSGLTDSNSDGQLDLARAMTMTFFIRTETKSTQEKPREPEVLEWEEKFLEEAGKGIEGLSVYYFSARSFGDIGGGAITGDLSFLFVGYALVIVYLALALGKFSFIDQKIGMAFTGILCVGMSVLFSYGLSSLLGFFFGPVHNVLPFLLLGIGVDDMFVFVAAWDNLTTEEKKLPVSQKIALMTKHAGVSILITSLTDFAAFGVGASTVIPALRSFCVYAAMGVLGIFFITLFFFAGVFTYDQRRAAAKYNACICCYRHSDDYVPNKYSENPISIRLFRDIISKILCMRLFKLIFFLLTMFLLTTGVYGFINIKQDFQGEWFIPQGNYFYDYIQKSQTYFPQDGDNAFVYFGDIEYFENSEKLMQLPESLTSIDGISDDSVSFWMTSFYDWLENSEETDVLANVNENREPIHSDAFAYLAHMFVNTATEGLRFRKDIVFDIRALGANYSATIVRSRMFLKFGKTASSAEGIVIMDETRAAVDALNLGKTNVFIYSDAMLNWDGDKVIRKELFQNVLVAFAVVFVVCLFLIAQIATVLLVLSCVVFTLVDVIGFAYLWGVTINVVSTINLVLAIGLAVDYAAHIGHAFMTATGSRNKRVRASLTEVGTAVFNGGFSTFLAFVPLGFSVSFVFWTFFQIFFLVSMFGLFHGLIYLPIALSVLGPSPYASKTPHGNQINPEIPLTESKGLPTENNAQKQ